MSKPVIDLRTMTTGNLPKPKTSSGGQTNTGGSQSGNSGAQQGGKPQKKE